MENTPPIRWEKDPSVEGEKASLSSFTFYSATG